MQKSLADAQYAEDFEVGDRFVAAPVRSTQSRIMQFANLYDPQRFHISPEEARATMFGGIISSGWQVVAETFGAAVGAGFLKDGGRGFRRIDDLKWLRPVRPEDDIRLEIEVVETGAGQDGLVDVTFAVSAHNQAGETVIAYRLVEAVARRAGGASGQTDRLTT